MVIETCSDAATGTCPRKVRLAGVEALGQSTTLLDLAL